MNVSLKINDRQAALLSHAIVEFQDNMNRQSHEDMSIDQETIHDIEILVKQILTQTKVEVYIDVAPHAFCSDEEIEQFF